MKKILCLFFLCTLATFCSCTSDNFYVKDDKLLSKSDVESVDKYCQKLIDFEYSLQTIVDASLNRSTRGDNAEYQLTEEEKNKLQNAAMEMDKCSVELLKELDVYSAELVEIEQFNEPLVATLTAYQTIALLDEIEAINPMDPVIVTPDGRYITYQQTLDMGKECILSTLGLDIGTFVGAFAFNSLTKDALRNAVAEIAKTVGKNALRYFSKGQFGLCLFIIQWGICMKDKLKWYGN